MALGVVNRVAKWLGSAVILGAILGGAVLVRIANTVNTGADDANDEPIGNDGLHKQDPIRNADSRTH